MLIGQNKSYDQWSQKVQHYTVSVRSKKLDLIDKHSNKVQNTVEPYFKLE